MLDYGLLPYVVSYYIMASQRAALMVRSASMRSASMCAKAALSYDTVYMLRPWYDRIDCTRLE